ncbi:hypothetical protein LSAT2_010487 [Lamellibrachia satsuma]|nr:hypothetical protein LSAT2_010487 [Lamellibrachia satsuma]
MILLRLVKTVWEMEASNDDTLEVSQHRVWEMEASYDDTLEVSQDRVWEMEASHDDTLEGSNWCVMLPSKKDKKLCPVGPFKGQICVTKSVQRLPYVIPPVPTKHVAMPEGLKMRNVPFGADAPLRKKSKKHRESYHRDDENVKKHKRKRHLEDSESTDVMVKDEQVDWVTLDEFCMPGSRQTRTILRPNHEPKTLPEATVEPTKPFHLPNRTRH